MLPCWRKMPLVSAIPASEWDLNPAIPVEITRQPSVPGYCRGSLRYTQRRNTLIWTQSNIAVWKFFMCKILCPNFFAQMNNIKFFCQDSMFNFHTLHCPKILLFDCAYFLTLWYMAHGIFIHPIWIHIHTQPPNGKSTGTNPNPSSPF